MIPEVHVDLAADAADRWHLPEALEGQAHALLDLYNADLGGTNFLAQYGDQLQQFVDAHVPSGMYEEIVGLAERINRPLPELLLANLHYDVIKFLGSNSRAGCTAFAIDTPAGPVHARNLDWWTELDILSRFTMLAHFAGAPAGRFSVVTWPGFLGAFSAIAPGRFTVTLNAVSSNEPASLSIPVPMLIRSVLENAATFDDAVTALATTPIVSDCMLLLTGTEQGEMVVIERTPTKHAIRRPENGCIIVTNDYILLADETAAATGGELESTSGDRFECVQSQLRTGRPGSVAECLPILRDASVQMDITVQQMAFSAATGEYIVRPVV